MTPESISISEASRRKDVTRATIYRSMRTGKLDMSGDFMVIVNTKFNAWQPVMIGARIRRDRLAKLNTEKK